MAYGINSPISGVDTLGASWDDEWNRGTMLAYYLMPWGPNLLDTDDMGFTDGILSVIYDSAYQYYETYIKNRVAPRVKNSIYASGNDFIICSPEWKSYDFSSVCWALGWGTVDTTAYVPFSWYEYYEDNHRWRHYEGIAKLLIYYSDKFKDPMDVEQYGWGLEFGTVYYYEHIWYEMPLAFSGKVMIE